MLKIMNEKKEEEKGKRMKRMKNFTTTDKFQIPTTTTKNKNEKILNK